MKKRKEKMSSKPVIQDDLYSADKFGVLNLCIQLIHSTIQKSRRKEIKIRERGVNEICTLQRKLWERIFSAD